MPISNYQESLTLCKSCIHQDCCGDTLKISNAWSSIAKSQYLDQHRFSFQIKCINFIDAGLVRNAIEAYQNKQEESDYGRTER